MQEEHTSPSPIEKEPSKATWMHVLGPLLFLFGMLGIDQWFYADAEGLTSASVCFGLLLWMAWWWLSEALPLAVTSLLPLVILPFFGVLSAGEVAPKYFSDTIALFFGGFCLALALEYTELHNRLATIPLKFVRGSASRAIGAMLITSGILSMWVSNTATTLALLPVALSVAKQLDPNKENAIGSRLILAVAFGAAIGGIGTIVGTPPNAFLQAYYNDVFSDEIASGAMQPLSFGRWMVIGIPIVALLLPAAFLLLRRGLAGVQLAQFEHEPTTFSLRHKIVMTIFTATVVLWLTRAPLRLGTWQVPLTGWGALISGNETGLSMVSDGSIAMLASLILLAWPRAYGGALLPWKYAVTRLPWGALLLFGGGLALAAGIQSSGLAEDLVASMASGTMVEGKLALFGLVGIILIAMTLFSEFSSNTAAAAIAIPLLASLGGQIGESMTLMIAGTLGASCGYAMPVATPPNTIAYGSGLVPIWEMVRYGIVLDLVAIGVMLVVILFLLPSIA